MNNVTNPYSCDSKVSLISKGIDPNGIEFCNSRNTQGCYIDTNFVKVISYFKGRVKEVEKNKHSNYKRHLGMHLINKYSDFLNYKTGIEIDIIRKNLLFERGLILKQFSVFNNPDLNLLLLIIDQKLLRHIRKTYSGLDLSTLFMKNNSHN